MNKIKKILSEDFSKSILGTIPLSIICTDQIVLEIYPVIKDLEDLGFSVLLADSYLEFRLNYEENYRAEIESGSFKNHSLIILTTNSLEFIDYDIYELAESEQRVFNYSFGQLFPSNISAVATISKNIPTQADEWMSFSNDFGRLLSKFNSSNEVIEFLPILSHLINKINSNFSKWCEFNYSKLLTESFIQKPRTLNNILPYIAYQRRKNKLEKIALLVFDGMSFDQWEYMKNIAKLPASIHIEEQAIFTMIPTLTSVSRQAIFSGKLPKDYQGSINTTLKEQDLWNSFWSSENTQDTLFVKPLEDFPKQMVLLEEAITQGEPKILGTVFPIVDELMHKTSQGYPEIYSSIKLWMRNHFFIRIVTLLLDNEYEIIITSDHGNIEALPGKKINEGIIVDTKDQRVRIYDRESAREKAFQNYSGLIKINPVTYALPENYYALVHEKAEYFGTNGSIITHGGLSFQEAIVPFIQLWRNNDEPT